MKILHVITSLRHGGAEKLVTDLLPRFSAMGAECQLAVFDPVETSLMADLTRSGIAIHRFGAPGHSVYTPANYLALRRLISGGHYDIVHTHNTSPQLYAALCPRTQGTALVTTEHNTTNRRRAWQWYKAIDRWMYRRYDTVISISQMTADNLVAHLGDDFRHKVTVVSNGVDIRCYARPPRPIDPQADVTVTMVAGFREQKDQDTLIKAVARLPYRFKLQLVGDGVRRPQMRALVRDLGLDERVDFLGERSDVPLILAGSDIIVLSSHYEGLSLSSIEAMASGRPLVASDVSGITDVVGGHGILFPEGDVDALRAELLRLDREPAHYLDTVARCQQRAAQYDISATARAYMDIYQRLARL